MVSASATSRSADGTVTVSPRDEASQSALVVFCHGLGDTSEGFADVAEVRIAVQRRKEDQARGGDISNLPPGRLPPVSTDRDARTSLVLLVFSG
jgi:hypothetical protein